MDSFKESVEIVADLVNKDIISIEHVSTKHNGKENYPHDFFYVYATLIRELHVLFPFNKFTMGVLGVLNVSLHNCILIIVGFLFMPLG